MTLTPQQIDERRKGIGGSDVAALFGLDPYRQAIDVFYEKRPDLAELHGYVPQEVDGDPVLFGNLLEEPIARAYTERTGKKVRRRKEAVVCAKAPWLRGNIDRDVVGERRGLEVKNVGWRMAHAWGPTDSDEVPEHYVCQVHEYLLLKNYEIWDVAALIGGNDLRIYTIERDREMDELIIHATREFWHNHVVTGIPPDIDPDHASANDTLKRVHSKVLGDEILLPDEAANWHLVAQEAAVLEKRYSDVRDNALAHLKCLVGDNGLARIPGLDGAYTRKLVHRKGCEVEPTEYVDFSFSAKR